MKKKINSNQKRQLPPPPSKRVPLLCPKWTQNPDTHRDVSPSVQSVSTVIRWFSPPEWTLFSCVVDSIRALPALHGEQKRSEIKLQLAALFTRGSVASPLTFVPKHRAQVVRSLLDDARHDDFAARLDENVRRTQYPGSKFYQKKKRKHKKKWY